MRIIQISDLHFGMHNEALINPFFLDLAQLKPDLIMISGDLTQRATTEQYHLLRHFLNTLPAPYLTVPGNHDIPLYNVYNRLSQPFAKYQKYVSPSLEAHFINNEVKILGVNSATPYKIKDGKLSKKTIKQIRDSFAQDNGLINILFFHHNLNYFSGMHHPLNNAEEFIHYLQDSSIHLVCTGHLHYANLKLIPKNSQNHCAILHAGSLLCERNKDDKNSFYVIDVNKMRCTIDWRVFNGETFASQHVDEIDFNMV